MHSTYTLCPFSQTTPLSSASPSAPHTPSAMTPITLRNLTAQPLTIKLVERYEAPNPKDFPPNAGLGPAANATANITSGVANITSGLSNLLSNVVGNGNNSSKPKDSSPKASPAPSRRASRADVPLSQSAQSFAKQEVDIRIEPFTTKKTDINTTERGPNDVLRLTLQGDGGGRWRIDTSITSTASKDLSPITNDPKHNYSAVYLPTSSFLAISETTDLPKWMSHLADHVPLSALSIPASQSLFINRLLSTASLRLPQINRDTISTTGATDLP